MTLLTLLYLGLALAALALTRAEARRKALAGQPRHPFWALAGVAACALWPLTLVAAAATLALRRRRAPLRPARAALA